MKRFHFVILLLMLPFVVNAQRSSMLNTVGHQYRSYLWADSVMNTLSLQEKVAQLFIVNVASQQTDANRKAVRDYIKDMNLGGIYFSGGTLAEHAAMNNLVRSYQKVPVMIGFDGEWGLAMRIKSIPAFPRNSILGCITDNELIYEFGREVGRNCSLLGINVDFAPDADVNTNPANPVIGSRSFGENPENVAGKVIEFVKGLESNNVLAVIKHFPGHGDTSTDSHHSLPVINHDRERLAKVELYPFRRAVMEKVNGVMVGHIEVPALEPKKGLPSSLSKRIIDILRNEYAYTGLVFTDALAMKGVAGFENVCLKALEAGNDMLLTPVPVKPQIDSVVYKAARDEQFRKLIEAKCRKVLYYKHLFGMHETDKVDIKGLEKQIVNQGFIDLRQKLYCAATTVIGNTYRQLPVQRQSQSVAVVRFGNNGSAFTDEMKLNANADVFQFDNIHEFAKGKKTLERKYSTIIVPVFSNTHAWAKKALSELTPSKLVYAFFTSWKEVAKYKDLSPAGSTMILANVADDYMQKHVARVVCGKANATGRLSMTIPWIAAGGSGVTVEADNTVYEYNPENYGMSSSVLQRIDSIAIMGINKGAYPGCQILVVKDGKPVYNKCFGTHTYTDGMIVRYGDIYDIASMTKTSATTLAVMKLYEQGKIKLDDKVSDYLSWLKGTDKEDITLRSLLYHESGLLPSIAFYEAALDTNSFVGRFSVYRPDANHTRYIGFHNYVPEKFSYLPQYISRHYNDEFKYAISSNMYTNDAYRQEALKMIADSKLKSKKYSYSCVGFILLKEVIEEVTGESLDTYLDREFYYPMGLYHTLYRPLRRYSSSEIIPSVKDDFLHRGELCGYVHDDSAAFFGGVSGNAGLFSNAMDMGKLYTMLLNGGIFEGKRYLSSSTCKLFTTQKSKISRRRLGFDCSYEGDNRKSPCSPKTPGGVFGHTGFTGTCVWADPSNNLVYIFLSNRLYPDATDNKLAKLRIRSLIQDIIYDSMLKG